MREIKFRAWVDTYSRWHMTTSFALSADGSFFNGGIYSKSKPEWKLLQYTGLKDKNGREIYEGDVIYWEIDNGVGIEKYSAIVSWSENTEFNDVYKWLVKYTTDHLRGGFDELSFPAAYNDGLQVIGNIYENPELLEVQGE